MELTVSVAINGIHGHFSACVDVPEYLHKAFKPIDVCDDDVVFVGGAAVCNAVAEEVMKMREDTAKDLSSRLTEVLVAAMKAYDLNSGYPPTK